MKSEKLLPVALNILEGEGTLPAKLYLSCKPIGPAGINDLYGVVVGSIPTALFNKFSITISSIL